MGKVRYPWRADIEHLVRRDGRVRAAWTAVILKWMSEGDLGPLADAITDGYRLEPVVLHCLASMIFKRTLVAKRQRHRAGRPKLRGKSARDIARALYYAEEKAKSGHVDAVQKTADKFRVSEKTVLRAITHWHQADINS
jgi:hypothetical protein